jgi:hypothetical protein
MSKAIPKGSAVYIRYLDHILYQNISEKLRDPAERETLGWLTEETGKTYCIQFDRTIEKLDTSSGTASGLILLKSCIIEMHKLQSRKSSGLTLISRIPILRTLNLRFKRRSEKFSHSE